MTFYDLVYENIAQINELLCSDIVLPTYMTKQQLQRIIKELEKMDKIRNSRVFVPYYPKVIADCWSFSSTLADELMEIVSIYQKIS